MTKIVFLLFGGERLCDHEGFFSLHSLGIVMDTLKKLCQLVDGQLYGADATVTSVSIDSRTLQPGALFIAIQGENFDGHDFVAVAQKKGAVAAIVSRNMDCALPLIQVTGTRLALGKIAAYHRSQFTLPIVALTGSCGKTTVKEMIVAILSQHGNVLGSQGNFNNDIGVPLSLLRLTAAHQYAVFEVGANHQGEIAYSNQLIAPDVALITNVGPAHIAGFGGINGVARAKAEILQALAPDGTAVLNADDTFFNSWCQQLQQQRLLSFAVDASADFNGRLLHVDEAGNCTFVLQSSAGDIQISLAVPGRHNIYNALAAAAAAYSLGLSLSEIKNGLETVTPVASRLRRKRGIGGAVIIDDSYNANPSSVNAALALLAGLSGKRILVLGDLAELGDETEFYHQQIGQQAQRLGIDALYTCGEYSHYSCEAFSGSSAHFTSQQDVVAALTPELDESTVVLIKGSRSAQMEDVVAALLDDTP